MNIIKNTTRIYSSVALVLILSLFFSQAAEAKVKRYSRGITAQAVYAVDLKTKKVLFSRNPRLKFYPASTVKLLTALVVLDRMSIDDEVRVSRHAASVAPTIAGLTQGAHYSVGELLKVLLATSANDAGVALAEAVAGSEEDFAVLMNKKARALGCKNSNFTNATGLPDKRQLTTAHDLSIITRTAFSNSFITNAMRKKSISIAGSDGKVIRRDNHNRLLWRVSEPCVLGKTGYTRSAGHCYAGVAYYDDKSVSVVIMKSKKPWADLRTILKIPGSKT